MLNQPIYVGLAQALPNQLFAVYMLPVANNQISKIAPCNIKHIVYKCWHTEQQEQWQPYLPAHVSHFTQ